MIEPQPRPFVWQMVRESVEALGGKTSNTDVRDSILKRYPGTNRNTIQAQITVCAVNHESRVDFPENHKPRRAEGQYDFLFRPARGRLEFYDPARHGLWEIAQDEAGELKVRQVEEGQQPEASLPPPEATAATGFALEAHLRDYLAKHPEVVEGGLELYVDEQGAPGVEYETDVGRIDILAADREGGLVVVELKVSRGPDAVACQLLRYKNWVKRHLAQGKRVRGFIIAQHISDRLRYSVADDPEVELREYELTLTLKTVPGLPTHISGPSATSEEA